MSCGPQLCSFLWFGLWQNENEAKMNSSFAWLSGASSPRPLTLVRQDSLKRHFDHLTIDPAKSFDVYPSKLAMTSNFALLSGASSPRPLTLVRQDSLKRHFDHLTIDPAKSIDINSSKLAKTDFETVPTLMPARQVEQAKGLGNSVLRTKATGTSGVLVGETSQAEIAKLISDFVTSFEGNVELQDRSLNKLMFQNITPERFMSRMIQYFNKWAEEEDGLDSLGVLSAVVAVIYLKRANLRLAPATRTRTFLAFYLVASKYLYDYYISNNYWASVGGIGVKELNRLEEGVCSALRFNFTVSGRDLATELANYGLHREILVNGL